MKGLVSPGSGLVCVSGRNYIQVGGIYSVDTRGSTLLAPLVIPRRLPADEDSFWSGYVLDVKLSRSDDGLFGAYLGQWWLGLE